MPRKFKGKPPKSKPHPKSKHPPKPKSKTPPKSKPNPPPKSKRKPLPKSKSKHRPGLEKITKKALENPLLQDKLKELGTLDLSLSDKKNDSENNKKPTPMSTSPEKILKPKPKPKPKPVAENNKSSTLGKISGFFSESEDEKKSRLIEKSELKKELGAEESILMSNNSPYMFALMWLISEKRV